MRLKPFDNDALGFSGVVPEGWAPGQPGEAARRASPADPTVLFQRGFAGAAIEELKMGLPPLLGLESFPPHVGTRETGCLAWNLHAGERELPGIGASPTSSRLAISRRKTPDLQPGSRKVALGSLQSDAGRRSRISFASFGGVKTSSLLRFARQVSTSGL